MPTKQLINNVKYIDVSRANADIWLLHLITDDNKPLLFVALNADALELAGNLSKGKTFMLQFENDSVRVDQEVDHNGPPIYWKISEEQMKRFTYTWKIAQPRVSFTGEV